MVSPINTTKQEPLVRNWSSTQMIFFWYFFTYSIWTRLSPRVCDFYSHHFLCVILSHSTPHIFVGKKSFASILCSKTFVWNKHNNHRQASWSSDNL